MNIYDYILLFFIYSFIGWIIETTKFSFLTKRFINRGFLIGPYIPIFGAGAVLITYLLGNSNLSMILLFFISALISGIVEYLISFVMEIIFDARWWDYSENKYNIYGRVCLKNLILFGIGSLVILKIFNPIFLNIFDKLSLNTIKIITYTAVTIYAMDTIITIITLFRIKGKIRNIRKKDATEKVNDLIKEQLLKDSILIKRIMLSHPTIIIKKLKQKIL
jgi:uncharacterized membrane protein